MESQPSTHAIAPPSPARKHTSRSRSGSEELKQILEHGTLKPRTFTSTPMSASSSSSGLSAYVTPVTEQQASNAGLLSWVRNTFLPSAALNRSTPSTGSNHISALPYVSVAEAKEPVDRQNTPLLPGIVPAFHRRLPDPTERDSPDREVESARSSLSHDAPSSAGEWTLERMDWVNRRRSSCVSMGTTVEDDDCTTSSDEAVYTPFAARELYDQDKPKAENVLAKESGPCNLHDKSDADNFLPNDTAAGTTKPRLTLDISEARDSQPPVQDLTPLTTPSVVLTPPEAMPSAASMSPAAGWTGSDAPLATISTGRTCDPLGSTANHPHGRQGPTFSYLSGQQQVSSTEVECSSGDGENLEDDLGRPRSPTELAKLRPSKESVVLGSRQAQIRAATELKARPDDTHLANARRKEDWDESRSKTPLALSRTNMPPPNTTEKVQEKFHVPLSASNSLVPTAAPQPKRATAFFTRRRIASQTAPSSEGLSVDEAADGKSRHRKEASAPSQRWRMSKRPINGSTSVAEEVQKTNGEQGTHTKRRPSVSFEPMRRGSVRSATTDSVGSTRGREILAKVGSTRRVLGPAMQPVAVKVRSRNKAMKESDFSRMYLAQELILRGTTSAANRSTDDTTSSTKPLPVGSPKKPTLAHLDSASSISSNFTSTSSTGSSTAQSRRKATWAMKFSLDGKYLAVAGQDAIIRVFSVLETESARRRVEEEAEAARDDFFSFPYNKGARPSSPSLTSSGKDSTAGSRFSNARGTVSALPNVAVFKPEPLKEFRGHTNDILDLSWSKGGFLLSASMDKTARIWHMSRPNSLVTFLHGDFVTSAVFHPRDDRFFLSGSLDGKLRLWDITSKRVQYSQEVPGLITTCAFTESGNTACVGTFAGHALFYQTDGLQYFCSIAVKSPSGKNAKGGRKITGIEPLRTGEPVAGKIDGKKEVGESVLITSNDSRVRAYDLSNKSMTARYKAKTYTNRTSQIRASVCADSSYIVAGSETSSSCEGAQVHIWDCSSVSKNRGTGKTLPSAVSPDSAVEYFTAHASTITCAVMAPLSTNAHLKASGDYIMRQSESRVKCTSKPLSSSSSLSPSGTSGLSSTLGAALKIGAPSGINGQTAPTSKLNRIIVTVDEGAVVRVWRSDSLRTLEGC